MWLYPKVVGFNPPERWGHSACFFEGVVYVFGVCAYNPSQLSSS